MQGSEFILLENIIKIPKSHFGSLQYCILSAYMFYWRTKQKLGEVLKKKRIVLGFSQEYISFETSIDRMGLSALENGRVNPTLFTLLKLCGVFHIKLWEVLREINV